MMRKLFDNVVSIQIKVFGNNQDGYYAELWKSQKRGDNPIGATASTFPTYEEAYSAGVQLFNSSYQMSATDYTEAEIDS